MRLWRSARAPRFAAPSLDDLMLHADVLRRNVEDLVTVRESLFRGGVIVFRGTLLTAPSRALDTLLQRFRPFGYTPFLRRDGDGTVVEAWPFVDTAVPQRLRVNVILFVLTCISTLLVGACGGICIFFPWDVLTILLEPWRLVRGLPFAFTLLFILATHEFGHYFTARHYNATVSLPYFIPAPPPFPFGTLGAIIRMRSPAKDRNSLFDIAAAGPLAGLVIALPAVALGLQWSTIGAVAPSRFPVPQFGDSLLMRLLTYLKFGPIPEGMDVFVHPMALAGWVGFLVTALNLFPIGQLDGGRIAYALFGRHHRAIGIAAFVALLLFGAITHAVNWFVWGALLFFLVGFHHMPPLDDVTPLSSSRRLIGFGCLVLLVLLIPPVPLEILEPVK